MASVQLERKQAIEAEKLLREARTILRKDNPEGNIMTDLADSLFGGALAAQKRFDEAEPLLLGSYRSLATDQGVTRSQRREALGRVVRLYEAMDKTDEAAKWRNELEEIQQAESQTDKQL